MCGRGGSSGMAGGSGGGMGKLVQTYRDGTKSYELSNAKMSKSEAEEHIRLMGNVVRNQVAEQLGVSRADIEISGTTVTKWNNVDPSVSGFKGKPVKEFYDIEITAPKVTNVKPDKTKNSYYKGAEAKVSLVYRGGKY